MKKLHTDDQVSLTIAGPKAMLGAALEAMRKLGFETVDGINAKSGDSIPWRESRRFSDPAKLPGQILAGARYREDLTQEELSERTGIPRRHISEMENGRRPIGKANARKLAAALNIDPRRFLSI
jgi:ribosome-binding protein aMBF1 (putative translation factor)